MKFSAVFKLIFSLMLISLLFFSFAFIEIKQNSIKIFNQFISFRDIVILAIPALLALIGAAAIALNNYLSGSGEFNKASTSKDIDQINAAIEEIKNIINSDKQDSYVFSEEDRKSILNSLQEQFSQSLMMRFNEDQAKAIKEKVEMRVIREEFDSANSRLEIGLTLLNRKANLNLIIGILTTSVAVGLLIYMVLWQNIENVTVASILAHYLPRLSIIIIIEIFAFFFLRLYRNNLAEIKYYNNELTTLSLYRVAVNTFIMYGTDEKQLMLVGKLMDCDRNKGGWALSNDNMKDGNSLEAITQIIQELVKTIPKLHG